MPKAELKVQGMAPDTHMGSGDIAALVRIAGGLRAVLKARAGVLSLQVTGESVECGAASFLPPTASSLPDRIVGSLTPN